MLKFLEDDRFFLYASSLHSQMEDAQQFVMQLPLFFWDAVARLLGCPSTIGRTLQDISLETMIGAIGYVEFHGLDLLKELPFSFTQGNPENQEIRKNIDGPRRDPGDLKS